MPQAHFRVYARVIAVRVPHGVSESILGRYRCSRCGRRYSVQYSLDRHQRYECGVEKQFVCGTCCRRFTRLDIMRVHQKRTGHNLAPYSRERLSGSSGRHYFESVRGRSLVGESQRQRRPYQQQQQRRQRQHVDSS